MTGELIDIHDSTQAKTGKVDTEHLFKLLEWKTIEAGINKYNDITTYRNCVEQMEILATGSTLMESKSKGKKTYYEKKKDLYSELKKKQNVLMKDARPGLKKSVKNQSISKEIDNLEVEFVTEWHKLLMKTLGRLFFTHFVVDRI
jgi:hypothetical protein